MTICVKCMTKFKPLKNGVYAVWMQNNQIDKIIAADLYICKECEHTILCNFAKLPVFPGNMNKLEYDMDLRYWKEKMSREAQLFYIKEDKK